MKLAWSDEKATSALEKLTVDAGSFYIVKGSTKDELRLLIKENDLQIRTEMIDASNKEFKHVVAAETEDDLFNSADAFKTLPELVAHFNEVNIY